MQEVSALTIRTREPASARTRNLAGGGGFPHGLPYFVLACMATFVWLNLGEIPPDRLDVVGIPSLTIGALALASVMIHRRKINGRVVLEPPVLVALVLYFWHFAFWLVYFAGIATTYRVDEYLNFAPEFTASGLLLCLIAILAMCAGIEGGMGSSKWRASAVPERLGNTTYIAAAVGTLLTVLYFVIKGRTLVGQYSDVFTAEDPLRRLYNLGIVLVLGATVPVLMTERNSVKRLAFCMGLLLPTILISAYVGTRWILFSAALLILAARTMRGAKPALVRALVLGAILIAVGTVVKEVRAGTVSSASEARAVLTDRYTNPYIEFFEELGQTFIPVAGTMQWTASGQPFEYGTSFAGATLTVIPSGDTLTGIKVPRPTRDFSAQYFPERFVLEGYTIGYSIIAELWLNFGVVGVLVGMTLFGFGLGRLYRVSLDRASTAALFSVWTIAGFAMFGVRNDAFTWLRYAVWGGILYWLVGRATEAWRARRHSRTRLTAGVR